MPSTVAKERCVSRAGRANCRRSCQLPPHASHKQACFRQAVQTVGGTCANVGQESVAQARTLSSTLHKPCDVPHLQEGWHLRSTRLWPRRLRKIAQTSVPAGTSTIAGRTALEQYLTLWFVVINQPGEAVVRHVDAGLIRFDRAEWKVFRRNCALGERVEHGTLANIRKAHNANLPQQSSERQQSLRQ
eukprot:scaffold673_cov410-Prasinococcus_capsulatus_cf.AAC.12